MKKMLLILVAAAFGLSGCAGVMEFRVPEEFKEGKRIEDPPGTLLPAPLRHDEVQAC